MGTDKRERQRLGRAQRLEEARLAAQRAQRRRQLITVAVVIVVVAVFGISALVSNRNKNSEVATGSTPSNAVPTTPTTQITGTPPKLCIDPAKSYTATFDTTAGTVKVDLDTVRTPGTTNNFVVLSRSGYYNGTPIFRADKSIDILQGGGKSGSDPGPGYTIPDEGGKFTYQPGQLVMARSSGENSGGAQWFFTTGPNASNLDAQGTYVTFGHVTEGLDILQTMLATASQGGAMGGSPNPPVTVNSVTIQESSTTPTTMVPVPGGLTPFTYGTGECTGPVIAGGAVPGAPGAGVPPLSDPGAVTAQPNIPTSVTAPPAGAVTGQPTIPANPATAPGAVTGHAPTSPTSTAVPVTSGVGNASPG